MGTMTTPGAAHTFQVGGAGTAPALLMVMVSTALYGRETIHCLHCGRAQYNKGKKLCVACRRPIAIPLEPLVELDGEPRPKMAPAFSARHISARLKMLRQTLGITITALAAAVGCFRTHIWKYEHQRIQPSIPFLERLAAAFNLSLAELVDESIPVSQLALNSMIRAPGDGEFLEKLAKALPKLNEHNKLLFLKTTSDLYRRRRDAR